MYKHTVAIFLLLFILGSCTQQQSKNDSERKTFTLPIVIQEQTKDTVELFKCDALNEVWFEFYGKHKFTDTLKLAEHRKRDTTYRKDFIHEYWRPTENDTLTTDGFQIFPDYKTTIHHKEDYLTRGNYYFPVYVVNETSRTKVFTAKDSYVFGVQEAIDTSEWHLGEWRPIESKGFDFCGNGNWGLKIHPGEFIIFLVPKYDGKEKQLMRIRLQIGESIYLSKSYEGTFNRKQFNIEKKSWMDNSLKVDKASTINGLFYGAKPKGYDYER